MLSYGVFMAKAASKDVAIAGAGHNVMPEKAELLEWLSRLPACRLISRIPVESSIE